jgi:DNA-binding beta-propeller fold protein YncE
VTGEALNAPSGVAIDQTGGVWVTNKSGNTVTHIFGAAAPVVTPLAAATATGTLGTKP